MVPLHSIQPPIRLASPPHRLVIIVKLKKLLMFDYDEKGDEKWEWEWEGEDGKDWHWHTGTAAHLLSLHFFKLKLTPLISSLHFSLSPATGSLGRLWSLLHAVWTIVMSFFIQWASFFFISHSSSVDAFADADKVDWLTVRLNDYYCLAVRLSIANKQTTTAEHGNDEARHFLVPTTAKSLKPAVTFEGCTRTRQMF